MLRHTHHRRLLAAGATTVALAATAPAAPAAPIDGDARPFPTEPERVQVVRVQVDEGLDWGDAGSAPPGCSRSCSSATAARARSAAAPRRERTAAHS